MSDDEQAVTPREVRELIDPQLEVLRPGPGDVVVVTLGAAISGEETWEAFTETLSSLAEERGFSHWIVLDPGTKLETLDAEAMRQAGWVRVEHAEVLARGLAAVGDAAIAADEF